MLVGNAVVTVMKVKYKKECKKNVILQNKNYSKYKIQKKNITLINNAHNVPH